MSRQGAESENDVWPITVFGFMLSALQSRLTETKTNRLQWTPFLMIYSANMCERWDMDSSSWDTDVSTRLLDMDLTVDVT